MNTYTYKVVTTSGNEYIWTFRLFKDESDYGNGCYVACECKKEIIAYVDVRYNRNFNIYTFCENYIKDWYRENLLTWILLEEDKSPM